MRKPMHPKMLAAQFKAAKGPAAPMPMAVPVKPSKPVATAMNEIDPHQMPGKAGHMSYKG